MCVSITRQEKNVCDSVAHIFCKAASGACWLLAAAVALANVTLPMYKMRPRTDRVRDDPVAIGSGKVVLPSGRKDTRELGIRLV